MANRDRSDRTAENSSGEELDRLVDSPVEIGTFQESDFDEGGAHYRVVVDAEPSDYDLQRMVADIAAPRGLGHCVDERSSLSELHCSSITFRTAPPVGAWSTPTRRRSISVPILAQNPLSLGELTAHEFFHLWNVKRIRPQSLEPID